MTTSLEAGTEAEHCQFVKGPAEELFVNRDEVRYSKGSHHVLVYETEYTEIPTQKENGTAVDTSGVFDCSDGATNGWRITKLIGGSQNLDGASMLSFPPDVAMRVRPNAVLMINAHYINTSSETIEPEVRINLHTIPKDQVKQEGDLLFLYNAFIHVGANGQGRARMRCKIHNDITIQNVQSHMHARGVGYEARIAGQKDPFYTTTKWEGVPVKDFGDGLVIKAGEWFDYACDYNNAEAREVFQGPRSTDEMCMLIGSYYPADPATAHCSIDPQNPLETGNLGAEWVGNGTATCAQTFGCVQQTLGNEKTFEGIMKCVDASDPAVSKEMSEALRCMFTAKNPLSDCQTQFAACNAK